MKLLIIGSRSIDNFDLSAYVPPNTELIISGGAGGVDALAEKYADKKKISKLILRPRYDLYGKSAPLKQNETMVDMCDEVLVIWDGISCGARYAMECATRRNKPVTIIKGTYD